jgi:A/G-specific adenine glycosylase
MALEAGVRVPDTASEHESRTVRRTRRALLSWYRTSGRRFWWRNQRDPFVTAVVEILLRQTRADVSEGRIADFLVCYPTPESLVTSSLEEIELKLSPLGFQRQRATQLHALGEALTTGARLGPIKEALLSLPGIGPYTANAIRCFVYGAREPAVDVNVARIVQRVFAVDFKRGEGRRNAEIWRLARALVQGGRPREMNWALIDLGALVCTARRARCDVCPLRSWCSSAEPLAGVAG